MLHLDMAVSILIMTPVRSFGEFIQQAMDETGLNNVTLVHDKVHLMDQVHKGTFNVVVLDLDLEPDPIELIRSLNDLDGDLRLVAMKDNTHPGDFDLSELKLAKFIDGKFNLPIFMDALNSVISDQTGLSISSLVVESGAASFPSQLIKGKKGFFPREAPEWLNEVERAAQYLTLLSLKSAAQAALICRRDELWAYAGHLARPAANELALSVWHYWDRDGGSDLARFIRLKANDGEYMLYATGLGGDYILALAFEIETPFSDMRTEAGDLARKLKSPPRELPLFESKEILPGKTPVENRVNDISTKNHRTLSHSVMGNESWPDQDLDIDRQAFFEDLLSAVEIPEPDGMPSSFSGRPQPDLEIICDSVSDIDDGIRTSSRNKSLHESAHDNEDRIEIEDNAQSDPPPDFLPGQGGNESVRFTENISPTHFTQDKIQGNQTKPFVFEDFDPITPSFHNLTYACILVPRMPEHHLIGELETFLNHWVRQFALVLGWRLEHLTVCPEYLHWVAALSPDGSPGLMIVDLKQRLSKKIFGEFPRLERENPSGEFWAPGFLIINGRDSLPEGMVDAFIKKTRSFQGVLRD